MAIENELPPHFTADAAHALEAARLTIKAMQRQVQECEDHNTELLGVIEAVRAWCEANAKAARTRAAQTGDDDWRVRQRVISEVWELVKPIV